MAAWDDQTRAASVDLAFGTAPVAARGSAAEKRGIGLVATIVGVTFWGSLVALIVGAAAVPGFALLFLLPLLGLPYLLFCFIALNGDRNVE